MMTAEIRTNVPKMAIWMADAAIREARRAITGNIEPWREQSKRAPYNLPEVEMAGRVLFNMFNACEADIRLALIAMPEKMDGVNHISGKNYFDEFVQNLDKKLRESAARINENYPEMPHDPDWPKEAEPRKSDWILEKC